MVETWQRAENELSFLDLDASRPSGHAGAMAKGTWANEACISPKEA